MVVGSMVGVVLMALWWIIIVPMSSSSLDGSKGAAIVFGLLSFPIGLIFLFLLDVASDSMPEILYTILMILILPLQWSLNGLFVYWLLTIRKKSDKTI